MSSLYRPKFTVLLPDGTRETRTCVNYYVDIVGADGVRRKIPAGPDKAAARIQQGECEREVALGRAHAVDPYRDSVLVPLSEHLRAYTTHLVQKGVTTHHQKNALSRCTRAFAAMDAHFLGDITLGKMEAFLATLATEGKATRTRNSFRSSVLAAMRWWTKTGIVEKNVLEGLDPTKVFSVRERRALTTDESVRLIRAAIERPVAERLAQTVRKATPEQLAEARRTGKERALAYKIMLGTALRLAETLAVQWADLDLSGPPEAPGALVCRAGTAKNRKKATLPIRSDLKGDLLAWKAENPGAVPTDPVVRLTSKPMNAYRKDLKFAGIPYKDATGRFADIHSLRYSVATHLAFSGVAPRTTQSLMRHSSIELSLGVYTDAAFVDRAVAVAALPKLPSIYAEEEQANG